MYQLKLECTVETDKVCSSGLCKPGLAHASSAPDEGEELLPRLWVFSEYAQHGASDSLAVHFLHATHYHAHVSIRKRAGLKADRDRYNTYFS